jgi:simple sugar transport system permease protein
VGIGNFFGGSLIKLVGSSNGETFISIKATSDLFKSTLPFAAKLGWFGKLFLSYGFLTYLAVIIAIVLAFVLKKTRVGLHLRAVGENPATADAVGISVSKYKYVATCIGSMIAGLGGLFYIMDYISGVWSNDAFGDRGWLAVALVIFVIWRPNFGIFGAFLFGALYNLPLYVPGLTLSQKKLFAVIPYVVTILVLVVISIRKKRENQPPASLGLSYFREER